MSRDARRRMEALEVGKSTKREVVQILGEPIPMNWLHGDNGCRALYYACVATVMRTRYLFSPRAILATAQDTLITSCMVSFNPDGTLKKIDYQEQGSNMAAANGPDIPRSTKIDRQQGGGEERR